MHNFIFALLILFAAPRALAEKIFIPQVSILEPNIVIVVERVEGDQTCADDYTIPFKPNATLCTDLLHFEIYAERSIESITLANYADIWRVDGMPFFDVVGWGRPQYPVGNLNYMGEMEYGTWGGIDAFAMRVNFYGYPYDSSRYWSKLPTKNYCVGYCDW